MFSCANCATLSLNCNKHKKVCQKTAEMSMYSIQAKAVLIVAGP